MTRQSPAKLLRNVIRMTKYVEKKKQSLTLLCNQKMAITIPPMQKILTRSTTVVTNFPEPCPMCHFNQCELEKPQKQAQLFKHHEACDKMSESCKEYSEEAS